MQHAVTTYGIGGRVALSHAEAIARTKSALAAEGFGVLCESDVQATLKAKLNIDRPPYVILGACNPPLAYQALEQEPDLGLLLPCNVVVYEDQGEVWVKAIEPGAMLSIVGNPDLAPIAELVRGKLERVLAQVTG